MCHLRARADISLPPAGGTPRKVIKHNMGKTLPVQLLFNRIFEPSQMSSRSVRRGGGGFVGARAGD